MIIIDIWGGPHSMSHVARHMAAGEDEAMRIGVAELRGGFLVNLRKDAAFGPEQAFDTRVGRRHEEWPQ